MSKKTVSVFTLAAFVAFSASCTTMRTRAVVSPADAPGPHAKIAGLVRSSGERVEFAPSAPGRVREGAITGVARARYKVPVEIQGPFSSVKRRPDGEVYEITDGGGRVHQVIGVVREGDTAWTILINDLTPQPVSIPLSDVREVRSKSINPVMTALLGGVVAVVIFLGVMALTLDID